MINNFSKFNDSSATNQVAGLLPGDENIEFIGIKATQQVLWLRNGHTLPWQYLPEWAYRICQAQYLSDAEALKYLTQLHTSIERQVELYIYHLYGDLDNTPDIKDGILQPSENYRHSQNCPSLKWNTKNITIDNAELTEREVQIIDLMLNGEPDKNIASALFIEISTLDFHKKKLYTKVGVCSKQELIIKALKQNV